MNSKIPEEHTKEQQSLNTPINEGEITENKTEQPPFKEVSTSVEMGTGESTQQAKTVLQPEGTENQAYESQALSEGKEFFNSSQNGLKSIPEGFEKLVDKFDSSNLQERKDTKLPNLCSDFQKVLGWLQSLKSGNNPNSRDIAKVAQLISVTDECLVSYSNLLQEHKNLKEKVELFESNSEKLKQEAMSAQRYKQQYESISLRNQQLITENNRLFQENERLIQEVSNYARQMQSCLNWRQNNESLINHNAALQNESRQIKQEYNALKNERDQLVNERGLILGELAAQKRDKTTTYTTSTSGNSRPQHHILYQEFKQLKDQEFNVVSNEIFHYRCERGLALKANRKQAIATIKSLLSEKVIINGMKLFAENNDFLPEIVENALKVVRPSFHSALGIEEDSEISKTLNNELEKLIKQGMKLIDGKNSVDTTARLWNEDEFTKAAQDISKSVYITLKMLEGTNISEAIRVKTYNLVKKGLELVKKIASADPPGILWIEKEGIPFKSDRHEAILGCEEGGKILLTVYPGYMVGDRVFEKALVFTVP